MTSNPIKKEIPMPAITICPKPERKETNKKRLMIVSPWNL